MMETHPAPSLDLPAILANLSFLSNWSHVDLDLNLTAGSGDEVDKILQTIMGAKRKDIHTVVPITFVYTAIFLTGVIGNIFTCIVIARNAYMRTVTNYYLFSLAVSDVLTLVVALPPELYTIWEAYPWHFGEPFCIFRALLIEMTTYASVLTITSFTIERYIAICHPIRGQRASRESRAIKCVLTIWIISVLCALPYPIHTRVFTFVNDPRHDRPLSESFVCNIPFRWQHRMGFFFQVSTFVFFIFPMAIITVMYLLIGMRLRSSALASALLPQAQQTKAAASRARRAVLKMLVAVVVAFFICWAPFHAQRLMTLYIRHEQWTPMLLTIQSHLFYISGVLYFLSCTVNPILYNLLSRKFRHAFKRTLCRCCVNFESHSIPALYKLKAKFVGGEHSRDANPSKSCYLYPDNGIRLAKFTDNDQRKGHRILNYGYAYPSTNETSCKNSSPTLESSSTAHAHSDGRLHRLCRHKYCSSRRAKDSTHDSPEAATRQQLVITAHGRSIISYPDIHTQAKPKHRQASLGPREILSQHQPSPVHDAQKHCLLSMIHNTASCP
ncbi:hypothetical protein BsWGS_12595 [Bradybaena similaris]